MRVLLISTDNPYITLRGGKHVHLLLLEKGLKMLGLEVTSLYYNPKSFKEIVKRSALSVFSDGFRYNVKLEGMVNYLKDHVPKKEFDIIHAHDVLSLLAVSSMSQKKVLTLHGYFARENVEFIKSEKSRKTILPRLLQIEKNAMKKADHVLTVDQRLKEYIISEFKYPSDKITVLHNAVDTSLFTPVSEEKQRDLKRASGFSANHHVILVPRRLVEKNGVIYAVQAMKHITYENVIMIIAGDGPERERIKKEANGDQRIKFVGMIPHDEIVSYYKMADIVVIPSVTSHDIQEASSLAMLEAMACGKVVVCSDIGGMKEIIQNGKTGIFVKEKEPVAIAEAIEGVTKNKNLSDDMRKKAREYVLQNHSFLVHASKVLQVYRSVLGEGGSG